MLLIPSFGAIINPIIGEADYDKQKALLGKKLFFDSRLSQNGLSCHDCHQLVGKFTGSVNKAPYPPSVLNSSFNYAFSKNGEVNSIKQQLINIFDSPDAYNTEEKFYIQQINKNPAYKQKFKQIYGKVNFENAIDALNEFILALRAPSRFDRFLLGDKQALSDEEQEGYRVFVRSGCIACHNGTNLGGGMTALVKRSGGSTYRVRVPSLRNVVRLGHWMNFHSNNLLGAILWLKNSVIGVDVSAQDAMKIIKFLNSLNSDVPSILK